MALFGRLDVPLKSEIVYDFVSLKREVSEVIAGAGIRAWRLSRLFVTVPPEENLIAKLEVPRLF